MLVPPACTLFSGVLTKLTLLKSIVPTGVWLFCICICQCDPACFSETVEPPLSGLYLDTDEWSPSFFVSSVLLCVPVLLSRPNPDDPLNCDAATAFAYRQKDFEQTTREWTRKHAVPHKGTPRKDASHSGSRINADDEEDCIEEDSIEGSYIYKVNFVSRCSFAISTQSGANAERAPLFCGCTEKNKSVQAAQLDAVECREYDECYSKLVHCLHDPNLMQPVQFKQNADESNSVHNSHVDNNLMQIDQLHVEDWLNLVRHFEVLVRDEVFTSKSAHKLSDPNLMQTDQNNIGETLQDCIDFDELMNDFHSSTASPRQSLSDHGSFDSGLLRDATHNGNLANSPAEAVYNAHLPGSYSQDK